MMSGSEGGGGDGKADVGRLREFYSLNQIQMRTRGEGVTKSQNFGTSYLEAPLDTRPDAGDVLIVWISLFWAIRLFRMCDGNPAFFFSFFS